MIKLNINGIVVMVETIEEAQQLLAKFSSSTPKTKSAVDLRVGPQVRANTNLDMEYAVCRELMFRIVGNRGALSSSQRNIIVEELMPLLKPNNPKLTYRQLELKTYRWQRILAGEKPGTQPGQVQVGKGTTQAILDRLTRYHPAEYENTKSYL